MAKTIVIHVSPAAAGKADGSPEHPFSTLEAARDALRARRRKGGLRAPVQVLVAPGVYRLAQPLVFTPEDGGTDTCPVTWSGHGGRPLISGGREITGWQEGTINGTVLPRVLNGDPHGLKLHLFYDKSVMELFINDGLQTVTRVAIPPSPALHLEADATGGMATLQSLTVWPIWPNRLLSKGL